MEDFGDFGKNKRSYMIGRRGYPEPVFYFLKVHANLREPVLDLGCGTGIATRQLVLYGFEDVQAVDYDPEMLEVAREYEHYKGIHYWHQEAASMTFRTRFFQLVTCFSSFHWFMDEDSITEIKRVLKKGGCLAVINKEDISEFRGEIKEAIEKYLGQEFPKIAQMPEISERLKEFGFTVESPKAFEAEDLYSLQEATEYIKSTSFWAAIPEDKKVEILDNIVVPLLEKRIEISKEKKGRISRRYQSNCLAAIKP
ncbi:MAG: class I SAM-dependent methyltransferase [Chlamydiia bacterium]|nr:class I SAM-dependent methyltransferase [Chlamydiia bacterium]